MPEINDPFAATSSGIVDPFEGSKATGAVVDPVEHGVIDPATGQWSKTADWYDTISSIPERVVQGTRAILPNFTNKTLQEELLRRKMEGTASPLQEISKESDKTFAQRIWGLAEDTPSVEARARVAMDEAAAANKRLNEARPAGENEAQQIVGGAFESLGPSLGSVGLIAATRGKAVPALARNAAELAGFAGGVGGGYMAEVGQDFQESIERGATVPQAARTADFAGAVSIAPTAAELHAATRAGIPLMRRIAETLGASAAEEWNTAFLSGYEQKLAWDPNRPHSEIWRDSAKEALGGLIGASTMGPMGHVGEIGRAPDYRSTRRYTDEQVAEFENIAREIENGTILTGVPRGLAPYIEQYGTLLTPDAANVATGAPAGPVILLPTNLQPGMIDTNDIAHRWELVTDSMDADRADAVLNDFDAKMRVNMQDAIEGFAANPEGLAAAAMITGRDPLAGLMARVQSGELGPIWYDNFAQVFKATLDQAQQDLQDILDNGAGKRLRLAEKKLADLANEDLSSMVDDTENTRKDLENALWVEQQVQAGVPLATAINHSRLPHPTLSGLPFTDWILHNRNYQSAKDLLMTSRLSDYLKGRQAGTFFPDSRYGQPNNAINQATADGMGAFTKFNTSNPNSAWNAFNADGKLVSNVTSFVGMTADQIKVEVAPGSVLVSQDFQATDMARVEQAARWMRSAMRVMGLDLRLALTPIPAGDTSIYADVRTDNDMAFVRLNLSRLPSQAQLLSTLAHELAHAAAAKIIANNPIAFKAIQNAWHKAVFQHLMDPNKTSKDFEKATRGILSPRWNAPIIPGIMDSLVNNIPWLQGSNVSSYLSTFIEYLAHQGERAIESYPELQTPDAQAVIDHIKALGKDMKSLLPSDAYTAWLDSRAFAAEARLDADNKQAMYTIGANLLARMPSHPLAQAILERAIADEAGVPTEEIATAQNPAPPNVGQQAVSPISRMAQFWSSPGNQFRTNMTAGAQAIGLDMDNYNRFGAKWQGLLQLTWRNPHIATLRAYTEGVMQWANTRMKWMVRANDTVKAFHALGAERIDQLTRFMLDETHRGLAYDMTNPADKAYVQQNYPKLDAAAREVYLRARRDFVDFLRAVETAAENQIRRRLAGDPVKQAAEIQELRKRVNSQISVPYFPMARFGNYMVYFRATKPMVYEGRNFAAGDLIGVFAFEGRREQQKFAERLAKNYSGHSVTSRMATQMERTLSGMNPIMIEAMMKSTNFTADQRQEMSEFLLKTSPAMSWVKHMMGRKKTLGYSLDGVRSFSDYFLHGSNHLARMMHGDNLREAITNMEQEELQATGLPENPVDSTKRSLIRQWVMDHYEYIMNPKEDWAKARAVVAIAYLAGSLRSAIVNLTQTATFTYPFLAAKYGELKAVPALIRQYKNAPRLYKMVAGMNQTEEAVLQKYMSGQVLTKPEEKMLAKRLGGDIGNANNVARAVGLMRGLQRAVAEGFLDESNATELAAMSEGGWMARAQSSSRLGYYGRSTIQALMWPFQEAEKLNRRVAFGAAYELAYDDLKNPDAAFEAAKEAVARTQFEYSKWNRAPALQGRKGLALMFWQYKLNALAQLSSDKSFFWRYALMQTALAGAFGLPFVENILDLIDWIMQRINPNRKADSRYEIQKMLEEHMDFLGSDAVLHGLSPLTMVDISGSMSMGQFLPFTDVLLGSEGLMHGVANLGPGQDVPVMDFKDLVQRSAEDAGGAAVALSFRVLKGLTSNDPNKVNVALKANPISFLRDASEATLMALDGEAKSASGKTIVEFDLQNPHHAAEIVAKSMGFQPTVLRTGRRDENGDLVEGSPGRDHNWLIERQLAYYKTRREMLVRGYTNAYFQGEEEAKEVILAQINAFNEEVGRFGLGIKGSSIRESIKNQTKSEVYSGHGLKAGQGLGLSKALRDREF